MTFINKILFLMDMILIERNFPTKQRPNIVTLTYIYAYRETDNYLSNLAACILAFFFSVYT